MAVFSISRSPSGLTASVDGQDVGRDVDAAQFHVGKVATGLSATFVGAVNDIRANAGDITVATHKPAVAPTRTV